MELHIAETREDLVERMARAAAEWIGAHPGSLVCLAAGDTPLPVYARLVTLQAEGRVDLASVSYAGLDEWVGLGPADPGSCLQVMRDAFYEPAGIPADRRRVFDGLADPEAECRAMERWIEAHGGIRFTLLGIGMNGHVGFNEPGAPDGEGCLVVALDDVTQSVGVKYFDRERTLRQGVTVGLRSLSKAEAVFLMATGERKADIVGRMLSGDPAVPASRLLPHPGLRIYLDREAAGRL